MSSPENKISHLSNKDFEFFYDGLARGILLLQKCRTCGSVRNPPAPMCPRCQSLEWTTQRSQGTGTVYTYTIHHHPPLPHFRVPHAIVLVELREGPRILASLRHAPDSKITIGMAVRACFGDHDGRDFFWFEPADDDGLGGSLPSDDMARMP